MNPANGSTDTALPLAGLQILVTRPAHQADELCRQLENLGASPLRFPTIKIHPIGPDDAGFQTLKSRFIDLDSYQTLIFVSANAVRLAYDWIDQYWPQLPVKLDWLAVGTATARAMQQQGLPLTTKLPHTDKMDSEALLAQPQLQQLDGCKVLICRGEGGRELLAQQLQQRGAQVEYAELYRRQRPVYSPAEIKSITSAAAPSAMLVSSGAALLNLSILTQSAQTQLSQWIDTPLIVPSQRVAELATQLHFNDIQIARNATDEAMLDALRSLVISG